MAVGFELRTAGTSACAAAGQPKKKETDRREAKNYGEAATLENDSEPESIVA